MEMDARGRIRRYLFAGCPPLHEARVFVSLFRPGNASSLAFFGCGTRRRGGLEWVTFYRAFPHAGLQS